MVTRYNLLDDSMTIVLLSGCTKCITEQNLSRLFDNLLWFICILPRFIFTLIRSFVPGHSNKIKLFCEQYNKTATNNVALAYHTWTGIPCAFSPCSHFTKKKAKYAENRARELNSFVWLAKAWCYFNSDIFYTSFNGRALACGENTQAPELVACDNESGSDLYFRDFIVITPEYATHKNELMSYLSKYSEELQFISDPDSGNNIHIHAKCLYTVDFNDNALGQFDWISERVNKIRMESLKWFNNIKLSSPDETKLL
jgi:hypothetical protein